MEVDQGLKVAVETSLTGAAPGLKLEFKGNDSDKADLSFTYKAPAVTVTGEFDISQLSSAKTSVFGGNGPFGAGVNADFKIAKSNIESSTFGAGVSYTVPKTAFFAVRAEKNFSNFTALTSYNTKCPLSGKDMTLAGQVNHNAKDTTATVATVYKFCPDAGLKVKFGSNGVVAASLKQVFDKKFTLVTTAEVPLQLNTVKLGVNATLG